MGTVGADIVVLIAGDIAVNVTLKSIEDELKTISTRWGRWV
jgi:hypothetical protein